MSRLRPFVLAACAVLVAAALRAGSVTAGDERALGKAADAELRGDILPFWLKFARDPVHGGFHALIGEDMVVHDDPVPHGSLLTCRVLWTFSAAYRLYHDPAYLEMATWAYRDLTGRFMDRQFGGLYWTVRTDGEPVDAHKQVYVEVFGIYSLAEYYRATGDQAALDQAIAIYRLIEARAHDAVNGGYFDSLERDWSRGGPAKSNLLGDAPKSQNSHIHILEGFTNLLRAWPDPGLKARQRELFDLTLERIIDPKTHHLVLFMKDDWTPLGDQVSYGHDIELSWLLVEAAEVLGDPARIEKARREAVQIARVTNAEGVDRDGGIYVEGNASGPTNTSKEWWEQAESVVGFLNAYQISGDPGFYSDALRSWQFIQDKVIDRRNGDWHNLLARDGSVLPGAKVSLWKCPYHSGRACMEIIERANALASGGR